MTTGYFNMAKMMTLVLMIAVVSSSCNKDKSDNCSINVGNVSGTYKILSLTYKLNATAPEQDYTSYIDDCERDDELRLNPNGTYDNIDLGVTCTPPPDDHGTWSLNGNIIISDGLVNGTIEDFDCNRMAVVLSSFYVPGDKLILKLQKK